MNNIGNKVKITAVNLLKLLPSRNRDVVSRRFGLKTGTKQTLESIGKSYGITRERVRQIEEVSLKQLKSHLDSALKAEVSPYFDYVLSLLQEHGGALREETLFEKVSSVGKPHPSNSALSLILTLSDGFVRHPEDNDFYHFWSVSNDTAENVKKVIVAAIEEFKTSSKLVPFNELTSFYNSVAKKTQSKLDFKAALSLFNISRHISKNLFNEYGLSSWPEIEPRGVRDKAYLVLKQNKTPKHFREITQLINLAAFSGRKANVQTVHNELIKDKRFVLVGRGTYGLSEWGFRAGTVKDVLIQILKENKQPLAKVDLVAKVLNSRMVKVRRNLCF